MLRTDSNYGLITLLLFWCALIVVSGVYITIPLTGTLAEDFSVTNTAAASAGSMFSFFYAIGFLVFGPMSDNFGRKKIIVTGLGLLATVTMVIYFMDTLYGLIILRGIQGFFAATFAPAALAYVFDVFPKRKLVTTVGFISFGFLTAGIFGQIFAGMIGRTYGWGTVFLVLGGLYMISMAIMAVILPDTHIGKLEERSNFMRQVTRILQQKNLRLCYLITFMLLFSFIGMYTVLGSYLKGNPFSLTENEILLVRISGIAGMVLSPFTGILAKKYGLLRVFRAGLLTMAFSLVFIGISSKLLLIVCMSVLFVAGISVTFPAIMTLVGELGGKSRATAASFYTFILFIGATLGPVVSIELFEACGYATAFILLGMLIALGFIVSLFLS